MRLLTLVLGVLFLPKANSLMCYECTPATPERCTNKTIECPSEKYRCVAAKEVGILGGVVVSDVSAKRCVLPEQCIEKSVNYGTQRVVQTSVCCNEDLCNSQIPAYKTTPNGKQCFMCEKKGCMATLNCVGNENYCITVTRKNVTVKGCASKLMCTDHTGLKAEQKKCCEGNYCNSTSSVSSTLLLLLLPVLFSALFS